MYLIELAQSIFHRFIGIDVYFRAIITEGGFTHHKMKNIDAYYGLSLVKTYNDEKKIPGMGLFLDSKLREYNRIFSYKKYSENYDFIYLTHNLLRLSMNTAHCVDNHQGIFDESDFPLSPDYITSQEFEFFIYPEIVYLQNIYDHMNKQVDPKIRLKYIDAWNLYSIALPVITKVLVENSFDLQCISDINWRLAINSYTEKIEYSCRANNE